MTKIFTDKDLQAAVKNLEQDGVDLKFIETKTGDNSFTISTKDWRTKIGSNDIGFWLEEQVPIKFKKPGFGLIEIIIAVAIIALLGGGGLYYREAQKQKSLQKIGLEAKEKAQALKNQIEEKYLEINGNTIETNRNSVVDTSNWKTYRNEKYGFEFKYPNEWGYIKFEDSFLNEPDPVRNYIPGVHIYGYFSNDKISPIKFEAHAHGSDDESSSWCPKYWSWYMVNHVSIDEKEKKINYSNIGCVDIYNGTYIKKQGGSITIFKRVELFNIRKYAYIFKDYDNMAEEGGLMALVPFDNNIFDAFFFDAGHVHVEYDNLLRLVPNQELPNQDVLEKILSTFKFIE